jgi:hypothetical protein
MVRSWLGTRIEFRGGSSHLAGILINDVANKRVLIRHDKLVCIFEKILRPHRASEMLIGQFLVLCRALSVLLIRHREEVFVGRRSEILSGFSANRNIAVCLDTSRTEYRNLEVYELRVVLPATS